MVGKSPGRREVSLRIRVTLEKARGEACRLGRAESYFGTWGGKKGGAAVSPESSWALAGRGEKHRIGTAARLGEGRNGASTPGKTIKPQ